MPTVDIVKRRLPGCTGQHPITKNYPVPDSHSTEVEKLWLRGRAPNLLLFFPSSNSHCFKLPFGDSKGVWGADSTRLNGGWDPLVPPPTPGLGWGVTPGCDELNVFRLRGDLC